MRNLADPGVDVLHAVRHRHGKNQKRHQDRERIEAEAHHLEQAELPDHGGDRADQRQHRESERADVEPEQDHRHHQRDAEERDDLLRLVDDIANDLREADDVHIEIRRVIGIRHDADVEIGAGNEQRRAVLVLLVGLDLREAQGAPEIGIAAIDDVAGLVRTLVGFQLVLVLLFALEPPANLVFELLRDIVVVELHAGDRIDFEQFRLDHRAALIVGHVAADDVGLRDVHADLLDHLRGRLQNRILGRNHVGAEKTTFDDFDETHVRREQRVHLRAVDAGQEEHRVGELLEPGEKILVVDVAVFLDQRNENGVGAAELRLILLVHFHVRMFERDRFVEAGIALDLRSLPAEKHGDRQQNSHRQRAARINQRFDRAQDAVGSTAVLAIAGAAF